MEKALDCNRILGIEARGAQRIDLGRSTFETFGITRGENHFGPLRTRTTRRLEANTGAPADYDNCLPKQLRLMLHGSGGGSAHVFSRNIHALRTELASGFTAFAVAHSEPGL